MYRLSRVQTIYFKTNKQVTIHPAALIDVVLQPLEPLTIFFHMETTLTAEARNQIRHARL